jgi:hypothetical protein
MLDYTDTLHQASPLTIEWIFGWIPLLPITSNTVLNTHLQVFAWMYILNACVCVPNIEMDRPYGSHSDPHLEDLSSYYISIPSPMDEGTTFFIFLPIFVILPVKEYFSLS